MRHIISILVSCSIVSLLIYSCGNANNSQQKSALPRLSSDTFYVYVQLNGYRGILCPDNNTRYYAKNNSDTNCIPIPRTLHQDTTYYSLDNGSQTGSTSGLIFTRDTATGRISRILSSAANVTLDSISVGGKTYSLLKLKTAPVTFKMNHLTSPYSLSAFPGICIYHDTSLKLIANMPYFIDNQTRYTINWCTPSKPLPLNVKANTTFQYVDNPSNQDAGRDSCITINGIFYFGLSDSGMLNTYPNSFAAIVNKNVLTFNTVPLNISLAKISNGNPIEIKWDSKGTRKITKDTTIYVINSLLNYMSFSVSGTAHTYFYYNNQNEPRLDSPYVVSKGASIVLNAYSHLAAKDHLDTCNKALVPDYRSTIPALYFGEQLAPGMATFVSYVIDSETVYSACSQKYTDVCSPNPVIFNYWAAGGLADPVRFLPVESYKAYPGAKDYNNLLKYVRGIKIDSIASINSYYVESSKGYIASTENSNYNNVGSAKGIVVTLKLRNGKTQKCYLSVLDDNGSIIWKEINYSCAK